MAKIAVFGGTFNPFHIGHYEMLSALCKNDMFDKVLLVPDKVPPHKAYSGDVPDEDRIEMCRIVCKDFHKAEISLVEFEREGKSYTVDTVKALKSLYPDGEFFVACGGDMIKSLDSWHKFDKLKKMVTFIAFNRSDDGSFEKDVNRLRKLGASIIVQDDRITDVSSSRLRNNPDSRFLPKKVWEYVDKRGIYKKQNS